MLITSRFSLLFVLFVGALATPSKIRRQNGSPQQLVYFRTDLKSNAQGQSDTLKNLLSMLLSDNPYSIRDSLTFHLQSERLKVRTTLGRMT